MPGRNWRFCASLPKCTIVGPSKPFADDADAPGSAGTRVLLVEDDLLDQRGAAAAELGGPTQPDPAVATELLFPLEPFLEQLVLVAGAAASAHDREPTVETIGEPRSRLGAKAFLVGSEAQVHRKTWHAIAHGTRRHLLW